MTNLESLLARCHTALKPDGYLFVNEYIGPNRMAYSGREKEVMQGVFQMYRRNIVSLMRFMTVGKFERTYFPDPNEVAKVDPSEAIHSEEIVSAIEARFQVKEFNFSGGTLLQYMLQDIAGNFRTEDREAMDMLDLLFKVEKTLVDAGDLLPHFALIVAQP